MHRGVQSISTGNDGGQQWKNLPLNVHTQIMEMFKNEWMWHLTLKVISNLNDSMILWDGSLRKRQICKFYWHLQLS